ncbi:MAG: N-acetylmuramoyl-L-alanine amidase [Verrucomicrobiota bacterium]
MSGPPGAADGENPTAVPAVEAVPVVIPSVMIDAGHGGVDGGTPAGGWIEKEWTLKVALALAEELRCRGHVVALTRTGDETVPLAERPDLVNSAPRTAVISIHFNAGAADARGIETWYSWPKRPEVMEQLTAAAGLRPDESLPDEGSALASAIQSSLCGKTGARDRGTKNRVDLALTSRCLCPAVIVECGFLSNPEEGRLIREESYRARLVRGISDGYETWLLNRSSKSAGDIPVVQPPLRNAEKPEDSGAEH